MARFRFRAQPALDLRIREYEGAQRELAEAERLRDIAGAAVQAAGVAIAGAHEASAARTAQAGTVTELQWYRTWIVRLEHERTAARHRLAVRETGVRAAAEACRSAHQRCEALEKFKARARSAFEAAEAAADRKLIDELATRRFVAARSTEGVTP